MPYLKITCPELDAERRAATATRLTEVVNDLFYNPRGPTTREELRERTTVHFVPYAERDLFIGGRTPTERGAVDLTVELSDWGMSIRQRRCKGRLHPYTGAGRSLRYTSGRSRGHQHPVPSIPDDGLRRRWSPALGSRATRRPAGKTTLRLAGEDGAFGRRSIQNYPTFSSVTRWGSARLRRVTATVTPPLLGRGAVAGDDGDPG